MSASGAIPTFKLHAGEPVESGDVPVALFLLTPTPDGAAVLLTLRLNTDLIEGIQEFPREPRETFCARIRELFEDLMARIEPPPGVVH